MLDHQELQLQSPTEGTTIPEERERQREEWDGWRDDDLPGRPSKAERSIDESPGSMYGDERDGQKAEDKED
jgi:hypothetical protein